MSAQDILVYRVSRLGDRWRLWYWHRNGKKIGRAGASVFVTDVDAASADRIAAEIQTPEDDPKRLNTTSPMRPSGSVSLASVFGSLVDSTCW